MYVFQRTRIFPNVFLLPRGRFAHKAVFILGRFWLFLRIVWHLKPRCFRSHTFQKSSFCEVQIAILAPLDHRKQNCIVFLAFFHNLNILKWVHELLALQLPSVHTPELLSISRFLCDQTLLKIGKMVALGCVLIPVSYLTWQFTVENSHHGCCVENFSNYSGNVFNFHIFYMKFQMIFPIKYNNFFLDGYLYGKCKDNKRKNVFSMYFVLT